MKYKQQDISDKTIMFTGGTSGIGFEMTLQLSMLGPRIILVARNPEKANRVCNQIKQRSGNEKISFIQGYMDSLASVKNVVVEYEKNFGPLHVLVNNAGVWETERKLSQDGYEMTWAVNHLAPFYLTKLLIPKLKEAGSSRIITVSSEAHRNTGINFDDPELTKHFPMMRAYSQSKLANILFTRLLAEKLKGSGVTANCFHPGVVKTPIFSKLNPLLYFFMLPIMISPAKAALTGVYLACAEEMEGKSGGYYKKMIINPGSDRSRDMDAAAKLWELSIRYTGL